MAEKSAHDIFLTQIRNHKLPRPELEFKFFTGRKWRFDLCWPDVDIAVEIEGGVFVNGRHSRGKGFTEDIHKYNTAQFLGYRVYRFTPDMISDGHAIKFISQVLISEFSKVKSGETIQ